MQLPLQLWSFPGKPGPKDVYDVYDVYDILAHNYFGNGSITVTDQAETSLMTGLEPEGLNGTNELRLFVSGNKKRGQAVVMGLIDNLGKGASGQAVQNLHLTLELDQSAGLKTPTLLD